MDYKSAIANVSVAGVDMKAHVITNFSQVNEKIKADLIATNQDEKKFDMPPYFALIWDAARGLLSFLAEKPNSFFTENRICEIGCGLALPSMYAVHRGARVVATDFHPDVPVFLNKNLEINGIKQNDKIQYLSVDWRSNAQAIFQEKIDVLMGSDILYDKQRAESVADFLNVAFGLGIQEAIIADSGRPYISDFKKRCEMFGLNVHQGRISVVGQGRKAIEIIIMSITLPGA